ncbi:MAG: ATP-binding protein [Terriglobales bacterium]
MNAGLLNSVWGQAGPLMQLLTDGSGVLMLLAAAFLVFRTFRESYLMAWIVGWSFYLTYRLATGSIALLSPPAWMNAVAQAAFVCAMALFVTALFQYAGAKRYRAPLLAVTVVALGVVIARVAWRPNSDGMMWAIRGLTTAMALAGGVQLGLFSRGRRQVGPWMVILTLLLLHIDQDPTSPHLLNGVDMTIELILGIGMLVMVLDDSKERTNRLTVVSVISGAMAQAQEHGAIILTALEQLKSLLGARAAWFRLIDGDELVLVRQVGLSEQFIRGIPALDTRSASGAEVIRAGEPFVRRLAELTPDNQQVVKEEGFRHILVVPVKGKTAVIGAIGIGQPRHRSYRSEEMKFLAATANMVGIAVENLRLVEQIIRSHRQWISTFDSIEDLVLVHDSRQRIVKVNRAVLEKLGHGFGDVVFQPMEKVLPGGGTKWQHCPYCEDERANFTEGPDPCFGGYSIVSTSAATEAGGDFQGTIHIIRDTSERRAAEQRYRLLFEQVQEGVFISTAEGRLIDCNEAFIRMLGYERREEVMALDIGRDVYCSPEQRQDFCDIIEDRNFVRNYEVTLRRKDGSMFTALENSFATRGAGGKVERYQGFLLDITAKKRAEDEVRRRNRELHALNSIAVIAAQSFDLDEILNLTLRQMIDLFNADLGGVYLLDNEGVLHRRASSGQFLDPFSEWKVPAEFLQRVRQSRLELLTEREQAQLPPLISDFVVRQGLKSWIWVIMWTNDVAVGAFAISSRVAGRFSDTDRNLLVAIGRQLATTVEKVRLYEETCRAYEDLRRTQEQLLQSEKMSAVGQLISGVAHEINNPLTAILGYAELLETEEISERARDFVGKLFKQAQRTQRLVQNLLSFARQRKPKKEYVDLRRVVEDTLALRDYDMKLQNIVVRFEFERDLPGVVADAHQMEQVFLNIINNAVDAMLERERTGGTLEVRVLRDGERVFAEFHDSGPGIRELNRVFDPFYTTKGVGKGTGLGLSICYGIVKEHGGDIVAFNHPKGGAAFRVTLPASAELPTEEKSPEVSFSFPLKGRVLVVDDEEAVLEFEREALAGAGAEVVAVGSTEEAIAHLKLEKFDAMLVDCTMSGQRHGIDFYQWVKTNLPGAERNIIFAVSNIRDVETRCFLESAHVPSVVKPFQVADLITATQALLARSRASAEN